MTLGRPLSRAKKPDIAATEGDRLGQIRTALEVARRLIELGQDEADHYRVEHALDQAEAAVDRASGFIADAVEAIRADKDGSGGATAAQLRRAFESGFVARSCGRLANPFEDPYGADWPGRRAHAAAWNRGRAEWEDRHGPSGSPVQEVRLAASREASDHRRRILEHQEKVEAEQRAQRAGAAARPVDPQLRMRLIGEVPRPEPAPPKRRRARTNKPVQPDLGT